MTVFKDYAEYYDLFYRDKDYGAEAGYVAGLVERFAPGAASILDLGCGTGGHDLLLADAGYQVTGIDRSAESIEKARTKAGASSSDRLRFETAEIQTLSLEQRFDAVVSLFHVMSYLTDDDDLQRAFHTARRHLEDAGVFVFDCWYGPAVLTDPPAVRVKRVETDEADVVRIAEPDLRINENRVDVHYQVLVRHKATGKTLDVREVHPMRYWFLPEIERMLGTSGFDLLACTEWMSGRRPGRNSWNICVVAGKNAAKGNG